MFNITELLREWDNLYRKNDINGLTNFYRKIQDIDSVNLQLLMRHIGKSKLLETEGRRNDFCWNESRNNY